MKVVLAATVTVVKLALAPVLKAAAFAWLKYKSGMLGVKTRPLWSVVG